MELESDDEFIIIGCDGIWDCLTNEEAVEFVRSRIDRLSPTEIGVEMLDQIISTDPRMTQGIGGDNMTIMIIDLQPQSRSGKATEEELSREAPLASETLPPTEGEDEDKSQPETPADSVQPTASE